MALSMLCVSADLSAEESADRFSWWPEDLVLAPIPGRSPEFGWGLSVLAGYFLDLDKKNPDTPSSIVSAFGWFSENNSYAAGAGAKLNLRDDKLRLNFAAGYIDINYNFYGIGNEAGDTGLALNVDQQAPLFYGSAKYELLPNTYFGLGYLTSNMDTSFQLDILPPDFPALQRDLRLSAIEIPIEFDTRDHEQFPREGWHANFRGMLHRESIGSDFNSESAEFSVNRYIPMRERDVLALRAMTRATGEGAPFFLLSTFGGNTDLRGYESGRYRDRMMYAVQAEYRWKLNDRWIFSGFAGVGEVAPSYSEFFKNLLPAAGVGTRFVISQKHKLSLSLDVAAGKHGAEFYFGIGEAF